ncbi:TonB-dependent receptor [Stenotrophomonas sp. HITSZ_GD]|uniref:TonB-dependent receptor n=1 Tax=Stenotrophomonas sp. HITSZ_GD TaxID=3037248 RepID=UPI00240E093D|nr:TonB-dependent receptor [Stenotrophomonas sp. HITSZ_GD]MDG2525762.1 TonB-dependent receptor [Stenotrophomonas sp. HITSZ_GD]
MSLFLAPSPGASLGLRPCAPAVAMCCLLPCLALAAPADAAAEDGIQRLEAVQVRADTEAAEAPDSPAPRARIDAQQIDRINVATSEDALRYAPNLQVRKRFTGDNNALVAVRGTSNRQSARTLVYADGLLLSNLLGSDFSFAPRWSLVAPGDLDSVDVLYGPYSARFPGNALGATILMHTRMPERFTAGGGVQFLRQDFREYGQHDTYDGRHDDAQLGDRHGVFAWRLSLDRLDNQSHPLSYYSALRSTTPASAADTPVRGAVAYRDPFGRDALLMGVNSEGATDTRNDQLALRMTYDVAHDVQLAVSFANWRQRADNAVGSWLRTDDGRTVAQGTVAIDGQRYVLPANAFAPGHGDSARRLYGATLRAGGDSGWRYSFAASRLETPRDRIRTASGSGEGPGTIGDADGSGWTSVDAEAGFAASAEAAHRLSAGAHADRYRLDSTLWRTDDWRHGAPQALQGAFAGNTRTGALYVQDEWRWGAGWLLVSGLRWEQWRADGGVRRDAQGAAYYPARRDDGFSPKLSLSRQLDAGWSARLSLARALRWPTVSELFQGSLSGTSIVNSDPNLQPEDAFSKDLTLERALAQGSLRLSLYEDDVRDTLFSQTDTTVFPNVTRIQNVDRVRTLGAEAAWDARDVGLPGLDLVASVAWNHAVTMENRRNPATVGKAFYRIPEFRADLLASYRITPWLRASLGGRYSGRQYNSLDERDVHPDTFGGTSRYLVFDARTEFVLLAGLNLSLGVDNFTNERYYVYHPYPGRTWSAELRYRY